MLNEENQQLNETKESKKTVTDNKVISKSLMDVKNNSWVGHQSDDTKELDYIMVELKGLIETGEVQGIDKIKILKQLQDLDNEKARRAMHLDNMLIKSMAIGMLSPEKQKEVKELW